ncbi:MAG: class I SAM-dependent methyltransferase [Promethearchaeota archaeon]
MTNDNEPTQSSIQSTMVGPLWARATFSQLYPDLLNDQQAAELIKQVMAKHPEAKAEFAQLQEFVDEFMGLNFLIRARIFDDTLKAFIEKHPITTIVNIGSGLDTTFSRVDNGRIQWYNLDLPDAIEYRKQLIPESPRSKCIPKSVFDYSWFDALDFNSENRIFFFAGGLFQYFQEEEVSALCKAMAERFPGGELIFDAPSKLGNRIINRRFKRLGVKGINFDFALGDPVKQISKWSDRIQVIEWFTLFARTPRNPKWKLKTRLYMNISDRLKLGKYAQVRFLE